MYMISLLNLLSGLGMVAVGAFAIIYWHIKKRAGAEYFLYGALLWAITISIKVVMDLTITGPLQSFLASSLPVVTTIAAISLYVGLRTGLLESGITYAVIRWTKLSRMDFNQAIALGIGFGGSEAIVLGLISLISVLAFIMVPELLNTLPPESRASILEQYTAKFIPIPVIERLFTLICHVFATILVVYAVKLDDLRWLALSIILKTVLDGVIPVWNYYARPIGFGDYIIIETFIMAMGIVSLAGIYWIKKYMERGHNAHQA